MGNRASRCTVLTVGCISVLCLFAWWGYQAGFRLNTGVSYPSGLYRLTDTNHVANIGDLVLFCPPDTPFVREGVERGYFKQGQCPGGFQPAIKKVAALSGTTVSLQKNVALDGIAVLNAIVRQFDGKGRPLPALADFVVPANTVFLLSDHAPAVSFDSRYYGSVPLENIQGHITPIFTTN